MARLSDALDIAEPGRKTGGLGTKPKPLDVGSMMEGEMSKVKRSAQENSLKNTRKKLARWENNWETSIYDSFEQEVPELTKKKSELFGSTNMKASGKVPVDNLVDFVKSFEGFSATPYKDVDRLTIGYGSKASGPNQKIDEDKAVEMLKADLSTARGFVESANEKYNLNLNENQIQALTSFTQNGGPGMLNKLLDNGNRGIEEIGESIELYNKSAGKVLEGLKKRRNAEYNLFNYGFNKEEE